MKRIIVLAAFLLTAFGTPAFADFNFFIGAMGVERDRRDVSNDLFMWGGTAGIGHPFGLEFEFQHAPFKREAELGFYTFSSSPYIETPRLIDDRLRFYGIGGLSLIWTKQPHNTGYTWGLNYGFGAKVTIVENFGIRADFRMYTFREDIFRPKIARGYIGGNLEF